MVFGGVLVVLGVGRLANWEGEFKNWGSGVWGLGDWGKGGRKRGEVVEQGGGGVG